MTTPTLPRAGARNKSQFAAASPASSFDSILSVVSERYTTRVDGLADAYRELGQGKAREVAGKVFEHLVDDVVGRLGARYGAKEGKTDYVTNCYGKRTRKVQVDRHLFRDGERLGFVECKTYLDASYLQRFVMNAKELIHALGGRGKVGHLRFGILAGQNALDDESLEYFAEMLREETGVEMRVFFLNAGMRSSKRPLYREKFPIVADELREFVDWIESAPVTPAASKAVSGSLPRQKTRTATRRVRSAKALTAVA